MSNSDAVPRSVVWASRLVVAFGVVTVIHWVVASYNRIGSTAADLGFTVLLLVATAVCGHGMRRYARWAWFGALALAIGGLFFVAPIAGTILLGGGTDPIGTGWDAVFFPLVTLILVALIAALRPAWRSMRPEETSVE
jgi:hypothetical protein